MFFSEKIISFGKSTRKLLRFYQDVGVFCDFGVFLFFFGICEDLSFFFDFGDF